MLSRLNYPKEFIKALKIQKKLGEEEKKNEEDQKLLESIMFPLPDTTAYMSGEDDNTINKSIFEDIEYGNYEEKEELKPQLCTKMCHFIH